MSESNENENENENERSKQQRLLVRESEEQDEQQQEQRAIYMSNECRKRLIESMKKINSKIIISKTKTKSGSSSGGGVALLLSGGIDSCSILEAASIIGMKFDLLITVVIKTDEVADEDKEDDKDDDDDDDDKDQKDDDYYSCYGPDLEYAIHAALQYQQHNKEVFVRHSIIKLTRNELINQYIESTVKTLAVWGTMDTRNSLVISAAMKEASKKGITDVVVGDGSDELFGGYEFMFGTPEKEIEWKNKRNSMINQWTFVTTKLGNNLYGLNIHEPYMDKELFVNWALKNVERYDCILDSEDSNDDDDDDADEASTANNSRRKMKKIQSIYNGPYINETCGKVLLREAFPNSIAAWRRMDFIDRGSGAISINEDYFTKEHHITDDEYEIEKEKLQLENGIKITCKEHLYNIRIYKKVFGSINQHPTKKHYPINDPRGCIGCCFEIKNAMFCHVCDIYPAQHTIATATAAATAAIADADAEMKIIRINILYSPPPDVGPGDGDDASQSYALRASEFFLNLNKQNKQNNNENDTTNTIYNTSVGPLAVNDRDDGLPWCINNDDNNDNGKASSSDDTTATTTTNITLFLISCTADGSVNRLVRKITRKLKNLSTASTNTNTNTNTTMNFGIAAVGLLGHARCDNSSKQMADTIFGSNGRKFDKALQQSSITVVGEDVVSVSTRLETQVELYGPEQDFDPWLEGLLQQFIIY
jgi:asparagine synthase (glutamine-hydrolysing)